MPDTVRRSEPKNPVTPDFDLRQTAKKLLREGRTGALATLMAGVGDPYCSLVNVATAADGSPLFMLSRLAVHTKNIIADPRASLMLDDRGRTDDPLAGARITLRGILEPIDDPNASRRYLARHPSAAQFMQFRDFSFYRLKLSATHLVAGFGRIVDLDSDDILTDLTGAETLIEAEPDIVIHMRADHADTTRLYATKLLGAQDGSWHCVGCDPEGLDLQLGAVGLRLQFPRRVTSPAALRQALKTLAQEARTA